MRFNDFEEDELFNQSLKLYYSGHYREAEELLRLSIKTKPNDNYSLIRLDLLVKTLISEGKLGTAERSARKLVRLSPCLEHHFSLADILFRREKFEEALQELILVVNEDADYDRGGLLNRVFKHIQAKTDGCKLIVDQQDQKEAFFSYLQYQGYMKMKIYREAELSILEAIELDPDNLPYHAELAALEKVKERYCPQCHEPIHPGWRRCPICGTDLCFSLPEVAQECPFCGALVDINWNSCPYCGRDPKQILFWGKDTED